jgi:hypothetical protein
MYEDEGLVRSQVTERFTRRGGRNLRMRVRWSTPNSRWLTSPTQNVGEITRIRAPDPSNDETSTRMRSDR